VRYVLHMVHSHPFACVSMYMPSHRTPVLALHTCTYSTPATLTHLSAYVLHCARQQQSTPIDLARADHAWHACCAPRRTSYLRPTTLTSHIATAYPALPVISQRVYRPYMQHHTTDPCILQCTCLLTTLPTLPMCARVSHCSHVLVSRRPCPVCGHPVQSRVPLRNLQLEVRLGKAQLGSVFIICAVFGGVLKDGWWITALMFGSRRGSFVPSYTNGLPCLQ
jgi:hypothetical protein